MASALRRPSVGTTWSALVHRGLDSRHANVTACQIVCVSIPFRVLKVAAVTDSRAAAVELAFDPSFHVPSSIAEVAADSQSWWPVAAVPPRVEGGDGNPEVAGEVLGAEQFIESFHLHIVARVDVDEITRS